MTPPTDATAATVAAIRPVPPALFIAPPPDLAAEPAESARPGAAPVVAPAVGGLFVPAAETAGEG